MNKTQSLVWVCIAYMVALYIAGCSLFFLSFDPLWNILIADIVATFVIFLFSRHFKNSSFYDAYWTVIPPFIALYWMLTATIEAPVIRQMLVLLVLLFWATRLTLNWATYWEGMVHEDWRYKLLRDSAPKCSVLIDFFAIHLFPTMQVFLGLLPIYAIYHLGNESLNIIDIIAFIVAMAAIIIQMFSDFQLHDFIKNKKAGETLKHGLWAWSRHPNYFGELGFWFGLFLFGCAAYPAGTYWIGAGFIAMLAMFVFASIPMMEKRSLQRRPEYQETIDTVSMFIPLPPKNKKG